MDVYQVLMKDHRIADELFREIEKSDDREVKGRAQLFGRLRKELEDHTLIEENNFLSVDREAAGNKGTRRTVV
jgi:hemerythrin superfamily protein